MPSRAVSLALIKILSERACLILSKPCAIISIVRLLSIDIGVVEHRLHLSKIFICIAVGFHAGLSCVHSATQLSNSIGIFCLRLVGFAVIFCDRSIKSSLHVVVHLATDAFAFGKQGIELIDEVCEVNNTHAIDAEIVNYGPFTTSIRRTFNTDFQFSISNGYHTSLSAFLIVSNIQNSIGKIMAINGSRLREAVAHIITIDNGVSRAIAVASDIIFSVWNGHGLIKVECVVPHLTTSIGLSLSLRSTKREVVPSDSVGPRSCNRISLSTRVTLISVTVSHEIGATHQESDIHRIGFRCS